MKFTIPDKLNVEFSDEERSAIETTLDIMDALLEKMKNSKYNYFSTEDCALASGEIQETRNILNFFFQRDGFYLE